MSPPHAGTPLGTSTTTPRPNRSGPCCSEGRAAVTVSPMTIQLILYRGKRDSEERTETLKSNQNRPGLLPPSPPPSQPQSSTCSWARGVGGTVGTRDRGVGGTVGTWDRGQAGDTRARECWWGWQQGAHGTGAPWGGGRWCPCPHAGPQEEEEDEEEEEKEEVSLWICTDSGGNGSVSPGRFLI